MYLYRVLQVPRPEPFPLTPSSPLADTMSTEVNNEYDLSLPISSLLRVGTSKAHEDAENSQGGVRLVKGELDKEEYVYFLMMLWHIYE